MKPDDWDELEEKQQKDMALELFSSMRGKYIISQALTVAIDEMKKVDDTHKEVSNIEDMEMLRDTLFPLYYITQQAEVQWRKQK